ncbi:unnamed protein product [Dicrocoelium dendriticum]|nr:unnamed protein product [Dicrocoelium dendriticum]
MTLGFGASTTARKSISLQLQRIGEKLCFVGSFVCICFSFYFYAVLPSAILYMFSVVFLFSMVVRTIHYRKANYLLFILDMCYIINILSLVFVWGVPTCHTIQMIQFGLANSHAYSGVFVYRNALVLHDFQKLVSCFIHVLPVLFSYLVRWYPSETSLGWYTKFREPQTKRDFFAWIHDLNWIYLVVIPLCMFVAREVLYYSIIYGCVKPSEKHLDAYRYMRKKRILAKLFWDRFHDRWHLFIWIFIGIASSAVLLCVSVVAWCSQLFHSCMLVVQLLVLCWNGACYYVDYYSIEIQRRMQAQLSKTEGNGECYSGHAVTCHRADEATGLLVPFLPSAQHPTALHSESNSDGPVCLPKHSILKVDTDGHSG